MALINILHKNSHVRMSAQLISHDYDQIFIEYLCVAFTMNLAFWILTPLRILFIYLKWIYKEDNYV